MGPGLMLAVALMQPTAPARIDARRKVSLPGNTSNPDAANASRTAFVLPQSPELSLMPATLSGYALSSRAMRPRVIGTWATGGMW